MANENDSQENLNLETENQEAVSTPAQETEKARQDFVPHQALHEQREITKHLRAQLAEANARTERMEGTFQKLLGSLNEKPVPAFDQDPLGHFQAREAELERQLGSVHEKLDKLGKEEQTQAQIHRLSTTTVGAEAEFRSSHPDYDSAVKYLKDISRQDLRDQGYGSAEVEEMLNQGKLAIAHAALTQGKDPAEALYERAKRYGFKGKNSGTSNENAIPTIAKGQQAAKTVEGSGTGAGGITLAQISQLSDAKLNEIMADDKKWQALIRGDTV